MGDVLMSQPAMRALKESVQDRKITLLTSSAGASIAPFIPEVDEIIPFDVPWVKTRETGGEQRLLALASSLRSRQFDAAVIFTVYSQNPLPAAMLCYLAGIETSWDIAAKILTSLSVTGFRTESRSTTSSMRSNASFVLVENGER